MVALIESPERFRWRGRALLFDLFGTVVHFAPRVPAAQVGGAPWRAAMAWLQEEATCAMPEVDFATFLTMLMRVTQDIVRDRPPEYREVSSRERFRRALLDVGIAANTAPLLAERLSLAHMANLAALTTLPAGHGELLQGLVARYRLGLISNFDHGPTARRILADHGIAHFFETVVISDEFGRRKPHPEIFAAALRTLGVAASEALFVGDSIADDVVGAQNAGVPMVWLNAQGEPLPSGAPAPACIIAALADLPGLLDAAF